MITISTKSICSVTFNIKKSFNGFKMMDILDDYKILKNTMEKILQETTPKKLKLNLSESYIFDPRSNKNIGAWFLCYHETSQKGQDLG